MRTNKDNSWRHFPGDLLVSSGLPLLAIIVLVSAITSWAWSLTKIQVEIFEVFALTLASLGAGLLFWAKLPLYHDRVYFSFGSALIPATRKHFYYWGMGLAVFGCVITALLVGSPNQ